MVRLHTILIILASACLVTEASAQRQETQEAKLYPPGTHPDYMQVWRDANAAAAHWRPDAKVYYINLGIDLGSKTLRSGEFYFFVPTGRRRNELSPETLAVLTPAQRAALLGSRRNSGWTMFDLVYTPTLDAAATHLIAKPIIQIGPAPDAAPANPVDPMTHLDGIDVRLVEVVGNPPPYIEFELCQVGTQNQQNSRFAGFSRNKFLNQVTQPGEWVWAAQITTGGPQGGFVYVDATTGEAHAACYSVDSPAVRGRGGSYTVIPCTVQNAPARKRIRH